MEFIGHTTRRVRAVAIAFVVVPLVWALALSLFVLSFTIPFAALLLPWRVVEGEVG